MFTRALLLTSFCLLAIASVVPAYALTPLNDGEMSSINGRGLALAFDNFSMRMAPTSYVELTGTAPTAQAAAKGWKRGDLRYYGLSMTGGSTSGKDWYGNGCTSQDGLGCPLGHDSTNTANPYGALAFASPYNPYILRVWKYPGYDYAGNWMDKNAAPTIWEFQGPTRSSKWRWAFWGELEVNHTGGKQGVGACNTSNSACVSGGANFLQSQTLIYGKNITKGFQWDPSSDTYSVMPASNNSPSGGPQPAILRMMVTDADAPGPETLALTYQSAISGDFRFSVNQTANSPDQLFTVPDFSNEGGMYFKNVDAYLPLGQLHYQMITFNGVSKYDAAANEVAPEQNGNFTLDLTQIPDQAAVYNNFYCGSTNGSACATDARGMIKNPNPDSHGYVRWGNWFNPAAPATVIDPATAALGNGVYQLPAAHSIANGIYFVDPTKTGSAAITNIGVSRIEGMLIQHLSITSLGAGT